MPITKDTIKELCISEHLTMKEVANKADMNYTGLLDKFRRNSITVRDLEKLLNAIGYTLTVSPHNKK